MLKDTKPRFAILDPLRFVAALAVLLYHYSIYLDEAFPVLVSTFKFGYLGVNFFFILSGFVIMASAQNRTATEFLFARALRIYPAFIICLAFTLLIAWWLNGETTSIVAVLANATILNDYFSIANVDGVYWTLQAEIKFYCCVFLLLATGLFQYWRHWLCGWLVTAIAYYFSSQPFFLSWFINPQYSFYFIGGICAYLLNKNKSDYLVKVLFFTSGLFAILIAREQTNSFMVNVGGIERNVAAILVGVIFLFFYFLANGYFNIKKTASYLLLGSISYPLYLIHGRAGKSLIDSLLGVFGLSAIFVVVLIILCVSIFVIYCENYTVRLIRRLTRL